MCICFTYRKSYVIVTATATCGAIWLQYLKSAKEIDMGDSEPIARKTVVFFLF